MTDTAVKTEVVEFYAKSTQLRLVRRPLNIVQNSFGQQTRQQEPVRYLFAPDGRITVRSGQDLLPDGPVDPETGEPRVQDALAWLRSHPLLNEQFYEEGAEPGRPQPTDKVFYELVREAATAQNVDALQGLLAQERGSHRRENLIQTCLTALTALGVEDVPEDVTVDLDTADREALLHAAQAAGLQGAEAASDEQLRAALALVPKG